MKELIKQAREAWLAARAKSERGPATLLAASRYGVLVRAAYDIGAMTRDEVATDSADVIEWAKGGLPPGVGDLIVDLAASGVPAEAIHLIAAKVIDAYERGDTQAAGVIHVDSDGNASIIALTPDHAADDGIGRPIGNA